MTESVASQSLIDRVLEATVAPVDGRGVAISVPFSALGGIGIGIALREVNEQLHPAQTLNCSTEIPVDTTQVAVHDMQCRTEVPYDSAVLIGGTILGAMAIYHGWKFIARSKLGKDRYDVVRHSLKTREIHEVIDEGLPTERRVTYTWTEKRLTSREKRLAELSKERGRSVGIIWQLSGTKKQSD